MSPGDSPDPGPAGEARVRRGRRTLHKLLLSVAVALGTLILAGVALEVGLRLSGDRDAALEAGLNRTHRRWAELLQSDFYEEVDDPVRRYAMRPGAVTQVDGWTFRANSHRSRGEEFPTEKPAGERRLLALGDSFCFGMWCDEDETVVARLAAKATAAERAAGSDVTWRGVNMGVPGYHTGQQLRALEQDGLAIDPDVVLLYFNTNDILADGFFYDEDLRILYGDAMPLPAGLRRLMFSSHLYDWIERRYEARLTRGPSPHLSDRSPWSHNRPENREATRAAIARIAQICRERHIPLFVIHQPLMSWMGDARDPNWQILPLVEFADGIFEEEGLPTFNMLGWMRGNLDGIDRGPEGEGPAREFQLEQYFADEAVQAYLAKLAEGNAPANVELPRDPDFHLNGDGYGALAELVYPRMRAAGILP
ncbi:SGNH/GDSL hydrolase family protein [Engelhardtia mirabilis]|uniref:SGNH hydrolase-type esterase domain-containing protein n=1 Tax=Engelhardtia mirabilis TaxID=2528011 RepID=A0A518BM85_9BACT|nr:hypothetical protein Pla133_31850 [Planctomycetes bacterium Pla133]QDV02417.1 hypothetical protein Pla86_31840 [Planctomycetes bacterium Pla86]